jgi:hypothetical protein
MSSIQVLRGRPTPEELAAVVAVLQALTTSTAVPPPLPRKPRVSAWADRAAAIAMRQPSRRRLMQVR